MVKSFWKSKYGADVRYDVAEHSLDFLMMQYSAMRARLGLFQCLKKKEEQLRLLVKG